jgi:hypothetical protein
MRNKLISIVTQGVHLLASIAIVSDFLHAHRWL